VVPETAVEDKVGGAPEFSDIPNLVVSRRCRAKQQTAETILLPATFSESGAVTRKNVDGVRQILAGPLSRLPISLHRRRTNVQCWSAIARASI